MNNKFNTLLRKFFQNRIPIAVGLSFLVFSCLILPGSNQNDLEIADPEYSIDQTQPESIPHTEIPDQGVYPTPSTVALGSITPTSTETIKVVEHLTASATQQPEKTTRFAIIGDYGLSGDPERDVANLVLNWDPDFIITTGDNNYPDGRAETIDDNIGQYFHEYIHPYVGRFGKGAVTNRFFPTLGNHDWNTDKAKAYFSYFTLPGNERYYDFVWGPVHFFAMDSDSREPDGVGRSSIQAIWLQEKLAGSISPWKIVYMHQPPYASAGDGSINWAQWPYKKWGASAVLSGHSHVYERILLDGFTYFINGLGGGPIYAFDEPVVGSQVRFNDDYGAMFAEASERNITFQFVTRGDIIIDSYTIEK